MTKRLRLRTLPSGEGSWWGDVQAPGIGNISREPTEIVFNPIRHRQAYAALELNPQALGLEFVAELPEGFTPPPELATAQKRTAKAHADLEAARSQQAERTRGLEAAEEARKLAEHAFAEDAGGWDAVLDTRTEVDKARLLVDLSAPKVSAAEVALAEARADEHRLALDGLEAWIDKQNTKRLDQMTAKVEKAAQALVSAMQDLNAEAEHAHDALFALAAARCRAGEAHGYRFRDNDPLSILAQYLPANGIVRAMVEPLLPYREQ